MTPHPLSLLRRFDAKVVGYRENSRDAVGTDSRKVFVTLVVDHAFEGDIAILHDDAYRLLHSQGVLLKRRVAVDRTVKPPAQTIIHGRGREDLNLVIHLLDTFDVLYHVLGIGLERRPHYLPE